MSLSSEEIRIQNLHIQKRLEKAIEYKTSLKKINVDENEIPELQEFSKILGEWVKNGKYVKGKVKLFDICRQLEYELATPKFTYIRLRSF
jgi:hypothetical protein